MNRFVCLLSASALVATIGCYTATDPPTPAAQTNASDPQTADLTLVTLKVPNMV